MFQVWEKRAPGYQTSVQGGRECMRWLPEKPINRAAATSVARQVTYQLSVQTYAAQRQVVAGSADKQVTDR